ncbi:MAG TPA: hypothetical protein VNL91_05665 [Thermoanaerobaculia bacterium]|nr:hypothetical protein [Thermoanaerobaculia bacterium]
MRAIRTAAAVLVLAICAGAAYRLPLHRFECERARRTLERGLVELEGSSDDYRRMTFARDAHERATDCTEAFPHDYAMLMVKAASEQVLGLDREAIATYRRALAANQRPEIYANLALVELRTGDYAAARRDLLTAAIFNIEYAKLVDDPLRSEIYAAITARIERLQRRASGGGG